MFMDHVKLIMKQDKVSEGDARLRAWCEGEDGYKKRAAK